MAVLRAAKVETAESKSRPSWQPWLGRGSRAGAWDGSSRSDVAKCTCTSAGFLRWVALYRALQGTGFRDRLHHGFRAVGVFRRDLGSHRFLVNLPWSVGLQHNNYPERRKA